MIFSINEDKNVVIKFKNGYKITTYSGGFGDPCEMLHILKLMRDFITDEKSKKVKHEANMYEGYDEFNLEMWKIKSDIKIKFSIKSRVASGMNFDETLAHEEIKGLLKNIDQCIEKLNDDDD